MKKHAHEETKEKGVVLEESTEKTQETFHFHAVENLSAKWDADIY